MIGAGCCGEPRFAATNIRRLTNLFLANICLFGALYTAIDVRADSRARGRSHWPAMLDARMLINIDHNKFRSIPVCERRARAYCNAFAS